MSSTSVKPPIRPIWTPRDYAELRARLAEDITAEPVVLGQSVELANLLSAEGIEP